MFFDSLTIVGILAIVSYSLLLYALDWAPLRDLPKRARKSSRMTHSHPLAQFSTGRTPGRMR